MDQAMAEFRQSFIWEQVKDTWQPAGPVLSIAEYTLDPARNGREKEILTLKKMEELQHELMELWKEKRDKEVKYFRWFME